MSKPSQSLVDCEMGLIGWIIVQPAAFWSVEGVRPEHFLDERRGNIWKCLVALRTEQGAAISATTIKSALVINSLVTDDGAIPFIADCRDAAPTSESDAKGMAETVRKAYVKRQVIDLGHQIVAAGNKGGDALENEIGTLYSTAMRATTQIPIRSMEELIQQEVEELNRASGEGAPGLKTGFQALDTVLGGGFHESDFIIIASRPSMGKSALAAWLGFEFSCMAKEPGAIFTLEMSDSNYIQRMLCARAHVNIQERRSCILNDSQRKRYLTFAEQVRKCPLHVDSSAALSITQFKARTRRLKEEHGIKYAMVDYLQLMSGVKTKSGNRQEEVTSMSKGCKEIAMDLGIPIVAVAQLNRGNTTTADNYPKLHHLRESGSLEADADIVILMHREDYYHNHQSEEDYVRSNVVELIVDKQRNGPTGTVKLRWVGEFGRFEDLSSYEQG